MIARIAGPDGRAEYVALHLDERTRARDVWVPVRGDRGARGEASELDAVKVCVRDVQEQVRPLVDTATRLRRLCDMRELEPSDDAERRALARSVSESFEWLEANMARLVDEPSTEDAVDIDAAYHAAEPTLPDDDLEAGDEHGAAGLRAARHGARLANKELADLEHLTPELLPVLGRDDPDQAKEIVLRCLEEYPALAPLLAEYVDDFVAADIGPDEISAVLSMHRKNPSLLALLVGLLAILAAAHPTPQ